MQEPLVSKIPGPIGLLRQTFDFNIGTLNLQTEYWQAAAILFLVFLLIWTFARWRHLYLQWNLRGFLPQLMVGALFGFLLALIVEGFMLIGGRTLFTELLGWQGAPKPISTALDEGRTRLVKVLGVTEEIPNAVASEKPTAESVLLDYESLSSKSAERVKVFICKE